MAAIASEVTRVKREPVEEHQGCTLHFQVAALSESAVLATVEIRRQAIVLCRLSMFGVHPSFEDAQAALRRSAHEWIAHRAQRRP
jgi:hypothetical protein